MINEPRTNAARDADTTPVREAPAVPFRILNRQQVAYGAKVLEFSIDTPIGRIEADLFEPAGRQAFVQPRSVRSKYSGEWMRTVSLDRAFATRVLEAVLEPDTPASAPPPQRPKQRAVEPNNVLLESERRFDAELEQLTAEGGVS